jgi:hypothetical protein
MKTIRIAATTIALLLAGATSGRAELRHVEIKTLGMD